MRKGLILDRGEYIARKEVILSVTLTKEKVVGCVRIIRGRRVKSVIG